MFRHFVGNHDMVLVNQRVFFKQVIARAVLGIQLGDLRRLHRRRRSRCHVVRVVHQLLKGLLQACHVLVQGLRPLLRLSRELRRVVNLGCSVGLTRVELRRKAWHGLGRVWVVDQECARSFEVVLRDL